MSSSTCLCYVAENRDDADVDGGDDVEPVDHDYLDQKEENRYEDGHADDDNNNDGDGGGGGGSDGDDDDDDGFNDDDDERDDSYGDDDDGDGDDEVDGDDDEEFVDDGSYDEACVRLLRICLTHEAAKSSLPSSCSPLSSQDHPLQSKRPQRLHGELC